jgi:hypothetical protein
VCWCWWSWAASCCTTASCHKGKGQWRLEPSKALVAFKRTHLEGQQRLGCAALPGPAKLGQVAQCGSRYLYTHRAAPTDGSREACSMQGATHQVLVAMCGLALF